AAEGQIIRTCKWFTSAGLLALALGSAPAAARLTVSDPARIYVQARAASMSGDHARAAQLLAALAEAQPAQVGIAKKALSEAMGAGQWALRLSLARTVPTAKLPSDARLLLVADEIRHDRPERALAWLTLSGENGDLSFLSPLVNAWAAADRGSIEQALATMDAI